MSDYLYILGAYQHTLIEDQDPLGENPTFGIVDAITGDTSGGSDGEGSGALIFLELHSSKEIITFPAPANLMREDVTVAHEVGHLFSGQHTDGGLMGSPITAGDFSNVTINKIRGLPHP
ncbi:MAG: hypothetical protein ACR2HG_09890 [Pyrinomonadaceae bacterium]